MREQFNVITLFSYDANFRILHTKIKIRKFEDCTMCYMRMCKNMQIKHINISNNWFNLHQQK